MSEVLTMMALEGLVAFLLLPAFFLGFVVFYRPRTRSWLASAQCAAASALCFTWANWILAYSLIPRDRHGSTLAPGAGLAPDGSYYLVDQYDRRHPIPEAEFWQQHSYEEGSLRLPWYVTPPALLVLLVGLRWEIGKRRSLLTTSRWPFGG